MERKYEQEWARMTREGVHTFQEVFSMTGLAESIKLLPWCISTGIPLCHMGDALMATEQQGKTAPATADANGPEEPSAPGLSSSPACSLETLPPAIPFPPDLPFEGAPSVGCPFFESLAGPSQKMMVYSPSGPFSTFMARKNRFIPQKWRLGVNTSLHGPMTTCLN